MRNHLQRRYEIRPAVLAGVLQLGFAAVDVTPCGGIQRGVRTGDVNAAGTKK